MIGGLIIGFCAGVILCCGALVLAYMKVVS